MIVSYSLHHLREAILPDFFKILLGLLGAVSIAFAIPALASFGDRGLALGIASFSLVMLGIGLRERAKDEEGRACTLPIALGTIGIFLLIAVLA